MGDLSSGKWHADFHKNQHFPWASVSTGNSWPDLVRAPVLLSCDKNWIVQHFGSGCGALASLWSCPGWILLSVLAVAEDVPGLQGWVPAQWRARLWLWNCPDNVPSLGLSDCLHLQISWTYGLCYCASLGWFSPEPMFSHHHFSVIWETLFAMETNICWARDADSGPAGLCSYSWVCVRAVRDSWLICLVLSLVLHCGVQSCIWLLTCQRGRRVKASRAQAVPLWGLCAALLPAPHPSVCMVGSGCRQGQGWH